MAPDWTLRPGRRAVAGADPRSSGPSWPGPAAIRDYYQTHQDAFKENCFILVRSIFLNLDDIAHELNAARMPLHARKTEQYAWIARTAAAREAEPEGGA